MLYSLLSLYITSLISDRVLLGISDNKTFLIITEKEEEIKNYIIKELKHNVTTLNAKGGYQKEIETVLMTSIPTKEYYELKALNEALKDTKKD